MRLAWPAVALVVGTLVGLLFRALLLASLRRWADTWSALPHAIRLPSILWSIVVGLWAANEVARQAGNLPQRLSQQVGTLLEIAVIVSVTFTVSNALTALVRGASERRALALAITGLGQAVVRAVVFVVGLLVLLPVLGIQITPILTALGVGGLAVALALQDTLSNLLAGVHLPAHKPVRGGDRAQRARRA